MNINLPFTNGYTFFYSHAASKYPEGDERYVFSQWHPCRFEEEGNTYASAEQYMMAKKAELFNDHATLAAILATDDPRAIKALGREVTPFDQHKWEEARYGIVLQASRLKFSQDPRLRTVLLGTRDTLLVEAAPLDCIWGIGLGEKKASATPESLWRGLNLLGKALTAVREELKGEGGVEGGIVDG